MKKRAHIAATILLSILMPLSLFVITNCKTLEKQVDTSDQQSKSDTSLLKFPIDVEIFNFITKLHYSMSKDDVFKLGSNLLLERTEQYEDIKFYYTIKSSKITKNAGIYLSFDDNLSLIDFSYEIILKDNHEAYYDNIYDTYSLYFDGEFGEKVIDSPIDSVWFAHDQYRSITPPGRVHGISILIIS
ncbi:MAG: hypothetical protein LBL95_00820, partial [Deltaproteobacteria bacterium]|nr:hypothetical protein [Deltaproteobacteria bacterium]